MPHLIHAPLVYEHCSIEFEREVLALQPALKSLAYRFCRNSYDSDDLVQETLCRAFRSHGRYQPGTKLKSWLFTIMANHFRSQCLLRRREHVTDDERDLELVALPSQEWSLHEQDVRRTLDSLPAAQREALLQVSAGVSYEEAAARLGCEVGTVKSRVSRARHSLLDHMGDIFVTDSISSIS